MRAEVLKGHLDLLLLSVIAAEPAHGYAVIERLRSKSAGAFDLEEGTVYPALHRLERGGSLSSRWESREGRKRRVYRVTAQGRRALGEQKNGFRAFTRAMLSVVTEGR